MKRSLYHLTRLIAPALILAAGLAAPRAIAEDAPAEPNLDAVLTDLAKIGPDQLVAHVEALRKQVGDLKAEAEAATKRAAELEAQSAAVKQRVETIEKFMAAVTASMAPAPEAKPEEAPAPEAKAEAAPEEAKPEPAPEAKAEAASEPAPEAAAG
ncbi:MAG: hypothetical protein KF886_20635 [Candidatus Hydrogenedentes bacterium]|nr:hypothetical protein [Candidatus Hydrogenedentota bacterium]